MKVAALTFFHPPIFEATSLVIAYGLAEKLETVLSYEAESSETD